MAYRGKAMVAAAAILAAGTATAQGQKVTGPVAEYWVSASTTSGFGLGAMTGGGGRPDVGALMGMMSGRPGAAQHGLKLQLGSSQAPAGAPQADHLPPASLGAGDALPLLTPQRYTPPPESNADPRPPNMQRPEGQMLIYWGCGERAGPGQPAVIDFAKIGQGQFPALPTIAVQTERPPTPERYRTYGEWPNERTRTQVPPQSSLVGAHTVKGDYSPQINFSLGPNQDFMAPLNITGQEPTPQGGTRLTWGAVPQSTGYFAWMLGGMGGGRGGGNTVVIWTSSQSQAFMGALMDYVSPSEARRLVAAGAVMSPQTTSCVVPAEVVKAAPTGLLSMIAYGDEANFVDPPRPGDPKTPWNISWRVKVRYKATTGVILGMPAMGGGGRGGDERPSPRGRNDQQPPQQQQPPRPSVGGILGGALRGGIGF